MTSESRAETEPDVVVERRSVMKAVGGTAVGVSGLAGVASAGKKKKKKKKKLKYHFYGCSQVCVNKRGVTAVIWNEEEEEFRYACIVQSSNRNDPPVRDWENVYCYEVGGGEAIVGICYRGTFIANPNRCAENYPTPTECEDAC